MNRAEKRRQQKLAQKAAKKTVGKNRPAIAPSSSNAPAHPAIQPLLNQAVQFHTTGRLAEAEQIYQQVLQTDPVHPVALHLLGVIFHQRGDNERAIDLIGKALTLRPDYDEALNNLGNAFQELGKMEEAVESYRKSLAANPRYFRAYNNLGNALLKQRKTFDAVESYRKALEILPDYPEALNNLGMALQNLGEHREAENCFRQAITVDPACDAAHSSLIFLQDLFGEVHQAEQQAERKRWDQAFIAPLADKILPHLNDRNPDRRLCIGYVSADFFNHSAYQGFAPLILNHDRQHFDVICYDGSSVEDDIGANLKPAATGWRDIRRLSDDQLAETIRADGVDILVDLSCHTGGNRLKAFGLKPAPVQVTGVGHLAPGISTIDYRLTTAVITPPEEEGLYPEKPVYLGTYFGFSPDDMPPVGPSPLQINGFLTFGFLGRPSKINEETFAMWARIVGDVPGSRMLLKHGGLDDPTIRQKTIDTFATFGISEDRLILYGRTDRPAHIAVHNQVDIILDTFPHGGGITAMESLSMGTPIIGISDANKASGRIIAMLCHPLGLDDLVATDPDDYYRRALEWAAQKDTLGDLKRGLRQRVRDVYSRFPHQVEQAYRTIWKRWCTGEAPTAVHSDE